jgi:hypothetical protein
VWKASGVKKFAAALRADHQSLQVGKHLHVRQLIAS